LAQAILAQDALASIQVLELVHSSAPVLLID